MHATRIHRYRRYWAILTLFLSVHFPHQMFAQSGVDCNAAIPIQSQSTCVPQSFITPGTEMWFSFTATSAFTAISVDADKFGIDVPHIHHLSLFEGNCTNPQLLADDALAFDHDDDDLQIDLNAGGLTIGNTYYIRADRHCHTRVCDKASCTQNNCANPAAFNICVEALDIIKPGDLFNEEPSPYRAYEENRGQLRDLSGNPAPEIKFFAQNQSPSVYVASNFVSFCQTSIDRDTTTLDTTHRVDMVMVGAPNEVKTFRTAPIPGITNYYVEHVPQGILGNKSYLNTVNYNLWPGIDLHMTSNAFGPILKFVVKREADASQLKFRFDGASGANVTSDGGVEVQTLLKNLMFEKAHVYRINGGGNFVPMPNSGEFTDLGNGEFGVQIQNYPTNQPLVVQIDLGGHGVPPLPPPTNHDWSTFFGGNGDDFAFDMDSDPLGNVYVGGVTRSTNFPDFGQDIFQGSNAGIEDAFAARFNVDYGQDWTTYYGGDGMDIGYDIAYSHFLAGDVYLAGLSESSGATLDNQGSGPTSFQHIGGAAFVVKLDPDLGSRRWATRCGGEMWASLGLACKIEPDHDGNIFIAGSAITQTSEMVQQCTAPSQPFEFPICNPGSSFTQAFNAGTFQSMEFVEGFIQSFNSDDELIWSTMFGGEFTDIVHNIAYDTKNDFLYVVGETNSHANSMIQCIPSGEFPICNAAGGFYEDVLRGTWDGFILRFRNFGVLNWGTYFGGDGNDAVTGVDIDADGNVYFVGTTSTLFGDPNLNCDEAGQFFPRCAPALSYDQAYGGGFSEAFIAKFDESANMLWSTFVGGGEEEDKEDVMTGPKVTINGSNQVWMYGSTRSGSTSPNTFPVWPFSSPGYHLELNHGDDGIGYSVTDNFIMGFQPNGSRITATYFGGRGAEGNAAPGVGDLPGGITTYQNRVYVCGGTFSTANFPLACPSTSNPYCVDYNGASVSSMNRDAFVAQIGDELIANTTELEVPETEILVFPNPGDGMVNIAWKATGNEVAKLEVFGLLGNLVYQDNHRQSFGFNQRGVDLRGFQDGVYFIRLTVNGVQSTKRYVLQR